MARVDADFQDDPIASLSLPIHNGHCFYKGVNLHYDVHDSSEDIKCALCGFEQSASILRLGPTSSIPNAKREKRPPRVSMAKKNQSVTG